MEKDLGEDIDSDSDSEQPMKKRRRGGERGRDWKCEFQDCVKEFKSVSALVTGEFPLLTKYHAQKKALNTHTNVTHLGKRDFICHYKDCKQSFGYKHLLQRHSAMAHQTQHHSKDGSEAESSEPDAPGPSEVTFDIDAITGHAYTKRANELLNSSKALRCPYPDIRDLTGHDAVNFLVGGRGCAYVFSRAYDFRRHLHATHDINVPKDIVEGWVRRKKEGTNSRN
jgi:hypothetical protein